MICKQMTYHLCMLVHININTLLIIVWLISGVDCPVTPPPSTAIPAPQPTPASTSKFTVLNVSLNVYDYCSKIIPAYFVDFSMINYFLRYYNTLTFTPVLIIVILLFQ